MKQIIKGIVVFSIILSAFWLNTRYVKGSELIEDSEIIVNTEGILTDNEIAANPRTAYIFVGDSRVKGMRNVVHITNIPDVYVLAKNSKGYNWLSSSVLPQLALFEQTTNYDKYIVICNLGVNDLGNLNKYIAILPELRLHSTELYWISVNPTVDSKTRVKCKSIENFNNTLKLYFPNNTWIDTYTYLKLDGFNAPDGLHYDSATYNKIFYYVMSHIFSNEFVKMSETIESTSQE